MSSDSLPLPKIYPQPRLVLALVFLVIIIIDIGVVGKLMISLILVAWHVPSVHNIFWMLVPFCLQVFVFVIGIKYFISSVRARLELSDEGVTLYHMRFRLFTPWHNIASMAEQRHTKGLLLSQPALVGVRLADGKKRGQAVLDESGWLAWRDRKRTTFLPLPRRVLAQGDFESYLYRYAPQSRQMSSDR
jgi:hypothetical protein